MVFEVYFREPLDGSVMKVRRFKYLRADGDTLEAREEHLDDKPYYIPIGAVQFWREI